jgi:threonine/homoserine/homoserine lactone efflux protein
VVLPQVGRAGAAEAPCRRYDRPVIPVWAFIAVALPLVLTPGASTAVVLRNSLAGGTRAGIATAVGTNSGSICYGLLSAFGLALALQRWPAGWVALRAAGVIYMGWLGLQSLARAFDDSRPHSIETAAVEPRTLWKSLLEGFATNALNPAIATFYLVLLPQFIPRGAPVIRSALLLTAIHVTLAATWHVTWAAAGGTLSRALSAPRPRRVLEAITGIALIALALKIARP